MVAESTLAPVGPDVAISSAASRSWSASIRVRPSQPAGHYHSSRLRHKECIANSGQFDLSEATIRYNGDYNFDAFHNHDPDTLMKPKLSSLPVYSEIPNWCEDQEFLTHVKECIDVQRRAADTYLRDTYVPSSDAANLVSQKALASILEKGADVHGISKQPEISNVIAFNAKTVGNSVSDEKTVALRGRIDQLVADKLRETFDIGVGWGVTCSGHFWYPPGGYMGWHTNAGVPDWRLYIAYSDEPDRSFFRFRDPDTSEVMTAMDRGWSVRLFHVDREKPFWHAVYSETNRFSLGYRIHPWRPIKSAARSVKKRLGLL